MKRQNNNRTAAIRTTAISALLAALTSVIVIIGSSFEALDLSCAAAASLIIQLCLTEIDAGHAFMIYACSAVLSFLAMPMTSCTLYFAAFFGYYPLVRKLIAKYIKRKISYYALLFAFYNMVMIALFVLFKSVFGVQNEPVYLYVLLLLSANLFFGCFELLTGRIKILFDYRIKKHFKNKH